MHLPCTFYRISYGFNLIGQTFVFRLEAISANLTTSLKNNFLKKLLSYWKLKRRHYNGVPLLRRLQSSQMSRKPLALEEGEKVDEHSLTEQMMAWQTLRQDFERVRLLLELIKKRERIKRDLVRKSLIHFDEIILSAFFKLFPY